MSDFDRSLLTKPARQNWFARFQVLGIGLITLFAILSRVYIQRLIPNTGFLELPLLLVVYFGLMQRSQVAALLFGAFVGLVEDSLAPDNLPLGMNGIAKTMVGYFAASVSLRFDVENVFIRLVLSFFFYFFHAFLYWVMRRALLAQTVPFDPEKELLHGVLNAAVSVPLFLILDRLKLSSRQT
jgi:rod shape-determining protein MreD